MAFDIMQTVTDRIIEQLESGIIPWQKPWTGTNKGAISYSTGKPYSLINQMLLGEPGEYITFNQCKALGGNVIKGSKSKMVVFWKIVTQQEANEDGTPKHDAEGNPVVFGRPVLRYFNVFNIKDCEGIKPRTSGTLPVIAADPDESADSLFSDYLKRSGCKFEQHLQDNAFYSPSADVISLPMREQFTSTAEYYSTLFHEATHSTGHKSRLGRFEQGAGAAAFGSESYSKEELVAEIGAATILNSLGMETKSSFRNSAAYIQSWLRALKNDKKMIVSAASRAEKAVALIMGVNAE